MSEGRRSARRSAQGGGHRLGSQGAL